MGFRKKIILSFSIVVFVISLFFGIFYYTYSAKNLRESAEKDIKYVSEQMIGNLSDVIDAMKHASDYLLSSDEMLDAMKVLSAYKVQGDMVAHEEVLSTLKKGICIDYFNQNFYRVIYFNEVGDVISSTNTSEKTINKNKDVSELSYLDEAAEKKGKIVVVGPHEDDWGIRKNRNEVISVVRKVQGGDYGYIEVQKTVDSIAEKFTQSAENTEVMAVLGNSEILFCSEGMSDAEELLECLAETDEQATGSILTNGRNRLVSISRDSKYDLAIVLVRDMTYLSGNMKMLLPMALRLVLLFFLVGVTGVVMVSGWITAPIRQLREQMEYTTFENLEENMQETALILNTTADEVVALGKAYQNLLNRLNEAVIKEKKLTLLQLQAQFDTLQVQVNPHFIYNVLNVISNRGIINGDEQICEICGSLAAMLRYSTSTITRSATIRDELVYLEKYAYLLKSRYEHKLEFKCECEKEILNESIPKIVLQQLVENSIQHGFTNGISVMKIWARGFRYGNGWCFEVQDNGQGVSEEVVDDLEKKIFDIRKKILMKHSNIEMEIGGMGLANIYARMFLMYGERTIFKVQNLEQGVVFFIGVFENEEEFGIRITTPAKDKDK